MFNFVLNTNAHIAQLAHFPLLIKCQMFCFVKFVIPMHSFFFAENPLGQPADTDSTMMRKKDRAKKQAENCQLCIL